MHFTLVLAALVASVSASALHRRQSGYPSCAQPCIANAQLGSCAVSDLDCLCHSADFISSTSQCINTSCSGDELENANEVARQSCLAVHVTLTSAAPASTSAAAISAATSPAASVSSSPVPSSSSTSNQTDGALAHSVNLLVVGAAAVGAFVAL